jgi:DNA polymerase III alpha subunit
VWRDLTRFAGYAFCKAHAAGYGTLGYHSAYLKTHFPTEYAVAILNHHAGMYATWVHVEDLRRAGVVFRAPCAVRSEWNSTLDDAAVRVGLSRVFGLHRATADRIVAARAERPFASLAELVERVRPTLPELESLIYAGALDALGRTRPSLLLEARAGAKAWSRHGTIGARTGSRHAPFHAPELVASNGHALRPLPRAPVAAPELPEFSVADRVRYECDASGLWFTAHPLDVLAAPEALAGTVPAADVERHAGRRVTVAGLPCASRPVETKSGERMLFLTLADRSGLVECVLFPDAYRRWATATRAQVVRVEGRVDDTLGALSVGVERVWGFGAGDRRAVEDGSRRHAGHSVR